MEVVLPAAWHLDDSLEDRGWLLWLAVVVWQL
jgi:hypothetical protein